MRKHSPLVVILLAACLPLLAAASPLVVKLLPTPRDKGLSQWKAVPNAVQYGKGEGLTEIYDGAYKDYVDAGVVDAVRNLYQRGNDYTEVTIHTMKSNKSAAGFFRRETKSVNPKRITRRSDRAMAVSGGKGYGVTGRYYVTSVAMYSGAKADKDARTFIEAALKRAALAGKAAKKK